ncbi:hypothetical protein Pmi06nite_64920 [Planotetraspora mira]|uniref:Uncharacterized protein n=1 Tax=Planotetraspora mira TaxID=58121 RepID=A0A8J3X9P3_9ACTN|nr:hypothetical protein Pmi06nite_64920 [Planotetraspora mira]
MGAGVEDWHLSGLAELWRVPVLVGSTALAICAAMVDLFIFTESARVACIGPVGQGVFV